jgi:hypothetical protein
MNLTQMNLEQLKELNQQIIKAIRIKESQSVEALKSSLLVGSKVKINHKKINPNNVYTIKTIKRKKALVEGHNANYNVALSLLEIIK